jgi:hypothetical protein
MGYFPKSGRGTRANHAPQAELGVNAERLGVNAVEISGLTPWKTGVNAVEKVGLTPRLNHANLQRKGSSVVREGGMFSSR